MPRQLYHLQVEGCGFPKWYNMPVKVLSVVCGLYEEKWLLFDHLGYFLTHLPTGNANSPAFPSPNSPANIILLEVEHSS